MKNLSPAVVAALLFGAAHLILALLGKNPRCIGTAVGTLVDSKKVMVSVKYQRKKVPVTACVYRYEVGGRVYRLKRDSRYSRSSLMRKVTVVYLKGFPRFGYLEKYPSGIFTILGVFYLFVGVWVLLMPYLE